MTKLFYKAMALREEMCDGVDTFKWLGIWDWWQALVNVVMNLLVL
jgi:hypothetical protein